MAAGAGCTLSYEIYIFSTVFIIKCFKKVEITLNLGQNTFKKVPITDLATYVIATTG